ncbi:hypothetical protein OG394_33370 [Kribbella sp. NBC_01245]|nr:hypothetical protein [Kribbella sp. NBC_01245]
MNVGEGGWLRLIGCAGRGQKGPMNGDTPRQKGPMKGDTPRHKGPMNG